MNNQLTLEQIRANERRSHEEIYAKETLYQEGSWLSKPIKTVTELYPLFEFHTQLRVLDLGCGIGRNCIATAEYFREIDCRIDCVDILELAIEKLTEHAKLRNLSRSIIPIVSAIDDYPIGENSYDWIMAISALEHMDSEVSFLGKLKEIRRGIRPDGVVTLVINSEIREYDKANRCPVPAQFEVNLPTEHMQNILRDVFAGWHVLKERVSPQCYDIPRDGFLSELHTNVITFTARK